MPMQIPEVIITMFGVMMGVIPVSSCIMLPNDGQGPPCSGVTQGNANHATHDADQDRFAQELLGNVGRSSTQSFTQANLPNTLRQRW